MGATTVLAIYAAAVASGGLFWQILSWRHAQAAKRREKEDAAISAVLVALGDVLLATGQAHGERTRRIMSAQSDKPVRVLWEPDRTLSVEADWRSRSTTPISKTLPDPALSSPSVP